MTSEEDQRDARRLISKLMSDALIDIRMAAHEGRSLMGIFRLADLFHNVPLALQRLEREGGSYEALLISIKEHADRNGSRSWLSGAIERNAHVDQTR